MTSTSEFKNISEDEVWNAENIYHLKTDIKRISKLINHYEIYKKNKYLLDSKDKKRFNFFLKQKFENIN
jgi:hypothetical protein